MKIAITGASGMVGSALVRLLEEQGHDVLRISRRKGPNVISWEPSAGKLSAEALAGTEAAIHLAGEPLMGGRWSSAKKRAILESRVQGTTLLATTLAQLDPKPQVLVSASGMSYYGISRKDPVDESAASGNGGFLPEVARAWEAATAPAEAAGIRVVHVRIGVVLSPEGGMLKMLLPQFQAGLGGPVGDGQMRVSWISRHDLARVFAFAIAQLDLTGPVNAAAPGVVTNREFASALGRVLGRPAVLPAPAFAVKAAFGQMARETVFSDLAMVPSKLREAGFLFDHPNVESALRAELDRTPPQAEAST